MDITYFGTERGVTLVYFQPIDLISLTMRLRQLLLILLCVFIAPMKAQFVDAGRTIVDDVHTATKAGKLQNRSAAKPTQCDGDTSMFPSYGSTAYNSVTIRKGSSLGQFFDAPQTMTVSGFRFYGFSVTPTPAKSVKINLICNLYKAGADSLPSGSPIASDTLLIDTVMGSSIPLSRITLNADFGKAVTVTGPYIVCVESDSVNALAAVVCNSYTNGDGKKRNLGVGSVSGKWYRCMSLNIGGTVFNSHMQMYPFVGYKLGIDYTTNQQCYPNLDTLYFQNQSKKTVVSSIFYNYYVYYNIERSSHRWNFDNKLYQYAIDGKYKPSSRSNLNVELISTVYPYSGWSCSDTVSKIIYFKPGTPSLYKPAQGCSGDTVTIAVASDAQTTVQWFKKTTDPKPFFEGNKYTVNNVQNTDTFFVKAVNNSCESNWLMIPFEVNKYPTKLTVKNDSICAGATANLQAFTDYGQLYWYDQATGGSLMYTGQVLQTGKLSRDTQFYVVANNKGCMYAGGAKLVKAFVGSSFAPTSPTVPADTFVCARGVNSVTLKASSNSSSDTLRWFTDATGGSPVAIGSTYTFKGTKRGDGYAYVESWNGICGSGRAAVKITVKDYPAVFGATGDETCSNDSAHLFGSTPWGQLNWYIKRSDVTPFYVGKTPALYGLSGKNQVYFKASEGACFAPNFDSVEVIVNDIPKPTKVEALSVCAKSLGKMSVTIPVGKVNWYEDSTTTDVLFTGSNYDLGLMLSSRTLYYETENKGCKSDRTPLTLVVKPRPAAGFTWTLLWQHKLNCVPINTAGLSFEWDWGDGTKKVGLPGVHQYAGPGNYTVRLIATSNANGCKDTADIPVLVDHTNVKNIAKQQFVAYPNPVGAGEVLTLQGLVSGELVWLDATGREIASSKVSDGATTVPAGIARGFYFLQVKAVTQYETRTLWVH